MATSGADLAIAWGTIGTAIVAGGGLLLSLWITKTDRRRADKQASADRAATDRRIDEERAHARDIAERDRLINLLLDLGRAYGRAAAGAPGFQEGQAHVRLLLRAIPLDCAVLARAAFGITGDPRSPEASRANAKLAELDPGGHLKDDPNQVYAEIASNIEDVRTGRRSPT